MEKLYISWKLPIPNDLDGSSHSVVKHKERTQFYKDLKID